MIAAIHVPVKRIEVEADDVTAADWHVENGRAAQKIIFAPGLATDDKWSARRVAPFQNDSGTVFGAIKTGCAISHAQPGPRSTIERVVLPKDMGVRRVTIGNGVVRPREGNTHMRSGSAGDGILRRGG